MPRRPLIIAFAALAFACSVELESAAPSAPSAPPTEGEVASVPEGEPSDPGATSKPTDAGTDAPPKATDVPAEILGTLSGSCGKVKALLTTSSPAVEQNLLAFVLGETYARANLSADGQRMYDTANAGGSSGESEVMSLEVLRACEGATLLKTETEVVYAPPDDAGPNTITDLLVQIDGKKVGVSVTRAYRPQSQAFLDADVKSLLEKKLEGILRSTVRVSAADRWVKQILHVFAATKSQADAVVRVLPTIDAAIRADTVVLLTQTTGGGFVYCNPDPPLGSECP